MDEKETIKKEPKEEKRERGKKSKKKTGWLEKKAHLEFIAAVLSVPLLISWLILNFNSIRNMTTAKPTPTPVNTIIPSDSRNIIHLPVSINPPKQTSKDSPTTKTPCKEGLGTTKITSPDESDIIADNPVSVTIAYDNSTYCAVAWSYRINGGSWSGYDDKSVALYNLPKGSIAFELRVKSITGADTQTLTRHFTYNGQSSTAVTPTTASDSAH